MSNQKQASQNTIALADCENGQHCQIMGLQGDVDTKMRLVNLGFHTHSLVEMIMVRGQNLVICVDGSRFAIDKEMAANIEVELLT